METADDDPEYAGDMEDDDSIREELPEVTDPKDVPPDEGDKP